jgi:hypothetical protein
MRAGFLDDEKGDRSMGRLISFIATLQSIVVVAFGLGLAVYETVLQTKSSTGTLLVTLGLGLFSSGALLKGWSKSVEISEQKKEG